MKKIYIFIVILILAVLGYFYFSREEGQTNIETLQNEEVTNQGMEIAPIISEYSSTTYTSVSISYPKSSETELSEVFLTVRDVKNDFLKAYGGLTPLDADRMYINADNPYELIVTTKIEKSSLTVTYILYVYEYTGGAHGGTSVYTFTYDKNKKLVKDADVFESDYLKRISDLSREYFSNTLAENKNDSMIEDGTRPVFENFRTWYITDEQIVFIFGQYQVGPYALGMQEFKIDKSKIAGVLKEQYE